MFAPSYFPGTYFAPTMFGTGGAGTGGTYFAPSYFAPSYFGAMGAGGGTGWKKNTPGCPCCGGGSSGGGSIPGCLCDPIPSPLTMTPGSFCGTVFQACTLRFVPKPAELAELPLGDPCILSDEVFYHDLSQTDYRWNLSCNGAFFGIRRAFYPSTEGGPFLDATFFSWSIGLPGNTCVPFLLSFGQIFPGGDPRCTLTISE